MRSVDYRDGKRKIENHPHRGKTLGVCATFNKNYMCCRVHVLSTVQNCPFECTYCFLQNYLTDGTTRIVQDINSVTQEINNAIVRDPERLFRIGTWELGDSLAFEKRSGQAARLVREFSVMHNAVLELKTKSDCVEPILEIDHCRKTVVSWSLNTDHIIKTEERGTASLDRRLKAMRLTADAGYLIGLHFDPMIYHKGWKSSYADLIDMIFENVRTDQIAWISIGSLRFNPDMKKKIENNYPDSLLTCAEMVCGNDSKMRYVKPLRTEMYVHLYKHLKDHIADKVLVYLCMERIDMWDKVFGWHPESIGHLDYLFARSLYEHFGIGNTRPQRSHYESVSSDNLS